MSFKIKYMFTTVFCTAIAVCAFVGAYRTFGPEPKIYVGEHPEDASAENVKESVQSDGNSGEETEPATVAAISQKDRISESTTIVYEYYYENEGKTERISQKAPHALINLTREQLVAKIEGFSVEAFSPSEVVLRKKIENKYILGIWDGNVAVFYSSSGVNQNGLKEVTDTPASALSEYEREKLGEGIVIDGDSELFRVLQDYGS